MFIYLSLCEHGEAEHVAECADDADGEHDGSLGRVAVRAAVAVADGVRRGPRGRIRISVGCRRRRGRAREDGVEQGVI